MKKPIFLVLAMSAMLPFAAQAQNTNTYTFTSFDVPFPNSSNTKAFDINPRGDIVGRFFDSSINGNPRGFLRHSDGTFAPPINVPTANTGTVIRGIDSRGDMVGKYFDPANPAATHGFYLGVDGTFIPIDVTLTGAIAGTTVAHTLNNVGQIVGFYVSPTSVTGCPGAFPLGHGFLRNTDRSFTPIDFPGATSTDARAIDDSGNIVGTYVTVPANNTTCDETAVVNSHGFLRDPKGNYTTLDVPASTGSMNTLIFRINDAADVAGVFTTATITAGILLKDTPAPSGVPNFVLFNNGSFTSFDVVIGGVDVGGLVLGINPRGDLVGVYTDGTGDHGFIATK